MESRLPQLSLRSYGEGRDCQGVGCICPDRRFTSREKQVALYISVFVVLFICISLYFMFLNSDSLDYFGVDRSSFRHYAIYFNLNLFYFWIFIDMFRLAAIVKLKNGRSPSRLRLILIDEIDFKKR